MKIEANVILKKVSKHAILAHLETATEADTEGALKNFANFIGRHRAGISYNFRSEGWTPFFTEHLRKESIW